MAKFCVDISNLNDETLSFFGYNLEDENEEFKIYRDKHREAHIVARDRPRLYVEDVNDAAYMAAEIVVAIPDEIEDDC